MVFLGSVSCIISAEEKPSLGVTGEVGESESEGVAGESEKDGVVAIGESEREGVVAIDERDTACGRGERVVAVTGDKEGARESFHSLNREG